MAQSTGDLESGLTRFLNTLYACFRFMSRFLVLCQFCECPTRGKKCKKNVSGDEDIPSEKTNRQGNRISLAVYSFPKRYILAIMTFLGFMNMYALRVNLNVAIGAMVNNHTVHQRGYTVTTVNFYYKYLSYMLLIRSISTSSTGKKPRFILPFHIIFRLMKD